MAPCERTVRRGDLQRGVAICLASFEQAHEQRYLHWAVRAYLYQGKTDDADKLSKRFLLGPRHGDAHELLSFIALGRGDVNAARLHAMFAKLAHALSSDEHGLTLDDVRLSQAAWQAGDFTAALDAADDAVLRAASVDDPHIVVLAHLARADALRRMGDVRGAAATLTQAIERAESPCDEAWARVKNAMCLAEAGDEGLALVELTLAARANQRCNSEDIAAQVMSNQAVLLRRKDPVAALALADALTNADGVTVSTQLLRGYLAADRGELAAAGRYLAQAAALEPPDADWPWEIARARAELAELRGGYIGDWLAEFHYRRATEMVAGLRANAQARSAYLVSSHRGPYDGLIALLARRGRWSAALAVILDLDMSDMLRATAEEIVARDRASLTLGAPPPRSAGAPALHVEDVLSAWRSRDLVIVIAPSRREIGARHEHVYRLRVTDGQVTGDVVAEASKARVWTDALFADPGDKSAATALGRMIVPTTSSTKPLYVLAIGALGKVPLGALRDEHGSLIIAQRPLVRVLALRAGRPASRGAGPPVVMADPRGDLRGAAAEGVAVAKALADTDAQLSGSPWPTRATRAQLWAARDASLLHIAGHVGVHGRWRALLLADGEVDPAEIVQGGLAPGIAVLAGCGSAAAMDEEGWGSIAAALLEAGTSTVIATDRSVGDAATLTVMQEFYAQADWRTDPARALARVQQALDASASAGGAANPRSWAAFSVLGRPPDVEPVAVAQ